jgi:ABC-type phosphate transport system permease subunit
VSLIAALIELLGRVVGEEMAVQLIVQAGAGRPSGVSSNDEKGGRDG